MHNSVQNLINIKKLIEVNLNNLKINKVPKIIAVSKTFSIDSIRPLIEYGHIDFGENKVQEAIDKWSILKVNNQNINLHLIGGLQTNKVKFAVKLFNTYKDISVLSYSLMLEALGIQLIQELNPELLREKYHLGWQINLDLSLREKRNFVGILNSLLNADIGLERDISMIISDILSDHLGRLKFRLQREGLNPKLTSGGIVALPVP